MMINLLIILNRPPAKGFGIDDNQFLILIFHSYMHT